MSGILDVELVEDMRHLDDERNLKLAEIEQRKRKLAQVTAALPQSEHYATIKRLIGEMDSLDEPDRYALRARINTGLKAILERITFDDQGNVRVWWHPHAPDRHHVWELPYFGVTRWPTRRR